MWRFRHALIAAALIVAAAIPLRAQVSQVVNSIVATTCTNQFVRSIASTGAATCAAIAAGDFPALTGDVTTPGSSLATTIAANAVTNAKMATMAANTMKANVTAGAAVPTDVNIGAWTVTSPTPTCGTGSGTWGTTTLHVLQIGKLVHFTLDAVLTTASTCSGNFQFALPTAAVGTVGAYAPGQEYQTTGKALTCAMSAGLSTMFCALYDATFTPANNWRFRVTGIYEAS